MELLTDRYVIVTTDIMEQHLAHLVQMVVQLVMTTATAQVVKQDITCQEQCVLNAQQAVIAAKVLQVAQLVIKTII